MGFFGLFDDDDTKYERQRLKEKKRQIQLRKDRLVKEVDRLLTKEDYKSREITRCLKYGIVHYEIFVSYQKVWNEDYKKVLKGDNMSLLQQFYSRSAKEPESKDRYTTFHSTSVEKNIGEFVECITKTTDSNVVQPADGIKFVISKELARAIGHLQALQAQYESSSSYTPLGDDLTAAIDSSYSARQKVAQIDKLIAEIKAKTGKE